MATATPLYNAIIVELERRRQAIGLKMEAVSQLAGTADRSYAKLLAPEAPSGRRVTWDTLQLVVDVLFCEGFELRLVPPTAEPDLSPEGRRRIIEEAVAFDATSVAEHMARIGLQGRQAQLERMTPEQRKTRARKAAQARWRRWREAQRADAGAQSAPQH